MFIIVVVSVFVSVVMMCDANGRVFFDRFFFFLSGVFFLMGSDMYCFNVFFVLSLLCRYCVYVDIMGVEILSFLVRCFVVGVVATFSATF